MGQGRVVRLVALLVATCLITACRAVPPDIRVVWDIEPSSGGVAVTHVTIQLSDSILDRPLSGARLTLEGHMAHPGMAPVVADVKEIGDGRYEARLPLTMAGRWTFVLSGSLANGRRMTHEWSVGAAPPA
jgi:hypothetical protein